MIVEKKGPKVSVVVPVYNVDNYLERCIDSILRQSFGDFELILVDDGSTDRSGTICDEYSDKDVRIKVIHQNNVGIPGARKAGLEKSAGEYILFVDSDDWVDANHIESMIIAAERERADVVFCGFYIEYPRRSVKCLNVPQSSTGKGIVIECLKDHLHAGVVFKLIRRNIFMDYQISFPKYNFFEDMYLTAEILLHAGNTTSTEEATYHYRYNSHSETNNTNPSFRVKKFNEFISNMEELADRQALLTDKDLEEAFYDRINMNKIFLLELPFSYRQEIVHCYERMPESWRWYRVGISVVRWFNYMALRYEYLTAAQLYKHFRTAIKRILKGTV